MTNLFTLYFWQRLSRERLVAFLVVVFVRECHACDRNLYVNGAETFRREASGFCPGGFCNSDTSNGDM